MPPKTLGKRKDQPVFRRPPISLEEVTAPTDEKRSQLDPNARKKTKLEQTMDDMDPIALRNLLDQCMAESLKPTEPLDPAILKRLARKNRQWEQPFNVPEIPKYTAAREPGERKIKRFLRSLVQIILDEATEDDARVPTPEVQHHPSPGPSTDLAVMKKAVFKPDQVIDSEDFVVAGSSRERE
ncbi:hypothetical protein FS837_011143 [Tulasnella sp. UAMH 9824]|nr:hypothetical protein FS837_011143 [Tulasnella sp. UAMH 9824]